MKRLSLLCVACLILVSICAPITANESVSSEVLSDRECLDFLERNGIPIPWENEEDCIPFVRKVLEDLYEDPQAMLVFNAKELAEFAEQIRQAYWEEINYNPMMSRELVESTTNILENNEVVGEWTDDYLQYNCYAYAIGYERDLQPGQLAWEEETQEFGTYVLGVTDKNVEQLAELVCRDLETRGWVIETLSTTKPNIVVTANTKLICIRKVTPDGDYHLMKLESDGYWYHKPGPSNPLKYTGVMSNNTDWVLEGYGKGININTPLRYFRDPDQEYDSEIYYITYSRSHSYTTYRYYGMVNGAHMHIKACALCGATTGNPMLCTFKNGSDKCSTCNHHKYQALSITEPILYEAA
jgi:hypothetical protein